MKTERLICLFILLLALGFMLLCHCGCTSSRCRPAFPPLTSHFPTPIWITLFHYDW